VSTTPATTPTAATTTVLASSTATASSPAATTCSAAAPASPAASASAASSQASKGVIVILHLVCQFGLYTEILDHWAADHACGEAPEAITILRQVLNSFFT
jgi:uncharacterized membrane protein